jgi:AcrR family transcriptional regulator
VGGVTDADQTLWNRTRRAVHAEITRTAMELFLERGFETVTVDEIARASGISRRSFFRYFGTKEDIVLGGLIAEGDMMLQALTARPDDEDPWTSLIEALRAIKGLSYDDATMLKISQMMYETPSLRARSIEKHLQWQRVLVPEVRRRLGASGDPADLRADVLVAGVIMCLDVAGEAWTRSGGTESLEDLVLSAANTLRPR